jgi:hypothetical protein
MNIKVRKVENRGGVCAGQDGVYVKLKGDDTRWSGW